MQVIGEIHHPQCRITLLKWNNRYIIKIEKGLLEQTFKINEFDFPDEEALKKLVSAEFIREALERFQSMHKSVDRALDDADKGRNGEK